MTFTRHTPRRSAIGIDIGARQIFAVQMDAAARQNRITASLAITRPDAGRKISQGELRTLSTALRRNGFVGNTIAIATPLEKQLTGVLEIPRSDAAGYQQMARMELARTSRCAPDAFEMDWWKLPDAAGESVAAQVMAVGCRHSDASDFLDVFAEGGFDVLAMDHRAGAIARACTKTSQHPGGMFAILELNWNAALLVVVYRDEVIYERTLADADLQKPHDSLVQRLQLDAEVADYLLLEADAAMLAGDSPLARQARSVLAGYADGLCSELRASLAFASQRYDDAVVDSLLLCGDGALMAGIDWQISQAVKIPVRAIAPSAICHCSPASGTENTPALIAATGLALP